MAGHFRGCALQEWNLLSGSERGTCDTAVTALRRWLDPGSKAMEAQDFRHISQKEGESVSNSSGGWSEPFNWPMAGTGCYLRLGMLCSTISSKKV